MPPKENNAQKKKHRRRVRKNKNKDNGDGVKAPKENRMDRPDMPDLPDVDLPDLPTPSCSCPAPCRSILDMCKPLTDMCGCFSSIFSTIKSNCGSCIEPIKTHCTCITGCFGGCCAALPCARCCSDVNRVKPYKANTGGRDSDYSYEYYDSPSSSDNEEKKKKKELGLFDDGNVVTLYNEASWKYVGVIRVGDGFDVNAKQDDYSKRANMWTVRAGTTKGAIKFQNLAYPKKYLRIDPKDDKVDVDGVGGIHCEFFPIDHGQNSYSYKHVQNGDENKFCLGFQDDGDKKDPSKTGQGKNGSFLTITASDPTD